MMTPTPGGVQGDRAQVHDGNGTPGQAPANRDATIRRNVGREARVPAVAIVLDLPVAVVLAQNEGRAERPVDPEVVRRHLMVLRAALHAGTLQVEGWASVVRLRTTAEVDALRLERRAVELERRAEMPRAIPGDGPPRTPGPEARPRSRS